MSNISFCRSSAGRLGRHIHSLQAQLSEVGTEPGRRQPRQLRVKDMRQAHAHWGTGTDTWEQSGRQQA